MLDKKITFDSFIRSILGLVVIVGILYLFNRLSGVLLPFFIAWLIAYMIYPLVKFFQYRLKFKSRILSIFCALATVLCLGVAAFLIFVPPMIEEFGKLKDLLITYFIDGAQTSAIPGNVSQFIKEYVDMKWLSNMLSEYHEYTSEHSSPGVEYVSTVCQHPIQYFCIFHYIIIHRFHSFGLRIYRGRLVTFATDEVP